MTKRGFVVMLVSLTGAVALLCGAELLWAAGGWWCGGFALWLTLVALMLLFWCVCGMWFCAKRYVRRYSVQHSAWWRRA